MAYVIDKTKNCEICYNDYDQVNYSVQVCPYCDLHTCKDCAIKLFDQHLQIHNCILCKKPIKIEDLNLSEELLKVIKE